MDGLFDSLTKEADNIANVIFPEIERKAERGRQENNIEFLKEAIRLQRKYTNRMGEIVRNLEKLAEQKAV